MSSTFFNLTKLLYRDDITIVRIIVVVIFLESFENGARVCFDTVPVQNDHTTKMERQTFGTISRHQLDVLTDQQRDHNMRLSFHHQLITALNYNYIVLLVIVIYVCESF